MSSTVPNIWAYHGRKDKYLDYRFTRDLLNKILEEGHYANGYFHDEGHTIPEEFYEKLRDVALSESGIDVECSSFLFGKP